MAYKVSSSAANQGIDEIITYMPSAPAQSIAVIARRVAFCAALVSSQVCLSPIATASEIKMEPSVELLASYSDNVNLATGGLKRDEWIAQINPAVSLNAHGNKAHADIVYKMQNIIYTSELFNNGEESSRIFHQLNADGKLDIVKDKAGATVSADYYQVNRPDTDIRVFDNLAADNYMINTAHLSLSPYAAYQYGDYSDIYLQYTYSRFDYSGANYLDGENNEIHLSIGSGTRFDRISWLLDSRYKKTNYFLQPDVSLRRVQIKTAYKAAESVSLLANAGYDSNKYERQDSRASADGKYWTAGVAWQPLRRVKINVLKGKRYYGNTASYLVSYYTRRSQLLVLYQDDVMTGQDDPSNISTDGGWLDQSDDVPVIKQDDGDLSDYPVIKQDGGDLSDYYDLVNLQVTTEAYIRKRSRLDYSLRVRKNTFRVNAIYDHNLYQVSGDTERILNGRGSWQLRLSENSSVLFSEYGQYIKYRDGKSKGFTQRFSLELERRINMNMTGRASYQFTGRYASSGLSEYEQNYIELGLGMKF